MTVIGITGYARHGKDTIAGVLTEEFGFKRVAFADALRAAVYALNPVIPYETPGDVTWARYRDLLDTEGYEQAKQRPEVRRLLQVMGTEVVRDIIGEDSWVNAWQLAVDGMGVDADIVVPDCRFPNEAEHIVSLGGEVWEVYRPDFDNGIGRDHPSEKYIDDLPTTKLFFNVGTIPALKEMVRVAMGKAEVVEEESPVG